MMFVGNNIQKDSVTGEDINYGQAGFANSYNRIQCRWNG